MSSMPGDAPIVVNSAGCGAALKDYGKLLGTAEADAFSARVVDASEWLAARVDRLPPPTGGRRRVIVQDPCHLRHVQRVHHATRTLVEHVRDKKTGDKAGYFGEETGVPAIVPAGSVVVFSSLSFHRSGPNTTDQMRRAYVTQYSPEIIRRPGETDPMHLGVPFLENGRRISPT